MILNNKKVINYFKHFHGNIKFPSHYMEWNRKMKKNELLKMIYV